MQEIINGSNIWQRGIMLEMNFENFVLDLKYGWWLVFPSYYSCTTDKYLEASITFWFLSRLHLWLITDTNLFSNLVWLHVNNSLAENQEIKSRKMQTFQIMPNFSLCTDQRVFFGIKRRKKMFLKNSLHQVLHWHSWMNHHSILKFKTYYNCHSEIILRRIKKSF